MHTLLLRAPAAAVVFPGQQQPLSATSIVPRHTLCRSSRLVCTASKGFGGKAAVNQVGVQKKDECPCGSGQAFTQCCGQYHAGAVEPNAEAVLRTCPQL
jgi:SEC-C motif